MYFNIFFNPPIKKYGNTIFFTILRTWLLHVTIATGAAHSWGPTNTQRHDPPTYQATVQAVDHSVAMTAGLQHPMPWPRLPESSAASSGDITQVPFSAIIIAESAYDMNY